LQVLGAGGALGGPARPGVNFGGKTANLGAAPHDWGFAKKACVVVDESSGKRPQWNSTAFHQQMIRAKAKGAAGSSDDYNKAGIALNSAMITYALSFPLFRTFCDCDNSGQDPNYFLIQIPCD